MTDEPWTHFFTIAEKKIMIIAYARLLLVGLLNVRKS